MQRVEQCCLIFALAFALFFGFGDLGGGVRVRTRNALHEMAGSELHGSGHSTDLDWHRASARASEPQPHIFYFITYFIIFNIFILS